jgi:hypothetical protein
MTDLVGAVEDLYLGVVTDPRKWSEQSFVDWSESVALDVAFDKELARYVRQAMRIAQKLQYFWRNADSRPDLEWTSKVDLALGPRAWRPILDLARAQLRTDPSEESFEEVVRLFPLVNNESFMDGIEFNQWSQQR